MTTAFWIAAYALQALFWLWLARWRGAAWIRSWRPAFLPRWLAWPWDEEVIRVFAWLSLAATTLWIAVGVFDPPLGVW